jgi:hypothetical protein
MQLPLRWNRRVRAALAGSFFLAAGIASALAATLDEDRTRGDIHGLFEIREAAVKFMAAENAKHGTRWLVLEPNRKILVAKCALPLHVTWVPKTYGLSGPNVAVSCARTVKPAPQHKWDVFVPVDKSPQRAAAIPANA